MEEWQLRLIDIDGCDHSCSTIDLCVQIFGLYTVYRYRRRLFNGIYTERGHFGPAYVLFSIKVSQPHFSEVS